MNASWDPDAPPWPKLVARLNKQAKSRGLSALWPDHDAAAVLKWGVAAATGTAADPLLGLLGHVAAGRKISKRQRTELVEAAEAFVADEVLVRWSLADQVAAVAWAYTMAPLAEVLGETLWWRTLAQLRDVHGAAVEQVDEAEPAQLLIAGELGLALAFTCSAVPRCKGFGKPAATAIAAWFDAGDAALDIAVARGGVAARLILAASLRCQRLLQAATRKKLKRAQLEVAWELTVWAAALTHTDGTAVFSAATRPNVMDDLQPQGLLMTAAETLDAECLVPAVKAALGTSKSRGKLAWQVSLPEPTLHSEQAALAVMLPEWDVRRGRVHVDYHDQRFEIEVQAGRPMLLQGPWEIELQVDGAAAEPTGHWTEVCHHSDDDVHYLELEQPWTGGLVVQRQIMVVRDDRCVMMADAVISGAKSCPESLEYTARWQVADGIACDPEAETWEVLLGDSKLRGLAMPLALPEWRTGPQAGRFQATDTGQLQLTVRGRNNLYAPLWIDMERKRFTKPRTWRQLTVAEFLRIVGRDEAAAYRVQAGDDQWLLYRSLEGRISRTALGKNVVADFYCGRFDPEDGYTEELVAVDDDDA